MPADLFTRMMAASAMNNADGGSDDRNKQQLINLIERNIVNLASSEEPFMIPEGTTKIGRGAFAFCVETFDKVTIPDTVTTIENQAFWYCDTIRSITIPESVTSIGSNAFEGCEWLTKMTINKPKDSIPGAPWGITVVTRIDWNGEIVEYN